MLDVWARFRHRRFRSELSAYLDGLLPDLSGRRLEEHLAACGACRQELAELRATIEALGSLPLAEVPRSFALTVAPAAEALPRPAARRLEFGLRLATAAAAFALAVVMLGDFAGLPGGGGEEAAPAAVVPAATETQLAMRSLAPGEAEGTISEPAEGAATPAATPAPNAAGGEETATPALLPHTGPGPLAEETPTPAPIPATGGEETPTMIQPPALGGAETATPAPPPEGYAATVPTPAAGGEPEKGAQEAATPAAATADLYGAEAQPRALEEGGGPSRGEVLRWLEVGLGTGMGVLLVLWALARRRTSV
jgi:hypothetical protein